jgi:hypothetical protein
MLKITNRWLVIFNNAVLKNFYGNGASLAGGWSGAEVVSAEGGEELTAVGDGAGSEAAGVDVPATCGWLAGVLGESLPAAGGETASGVSDASLTAVLDASLPAAGGTTIDWLVLDASAAGGVTGGGAGTGAELAGVDVPATCGWLAGVLGESLPAAGGETAAGWIAMLGGAIMLNVLAFFTAKAIQLKVMSVGAGLFKMMLKPLTLLLTTR